MQLATQEQFSPDSTLKSWYWITEWMKMCWREFRSDQIIKAPSFTDKNYTALLVYLVGSEYGYNIDLETFNEQLEEIIDSSNFYKEFLAVQNRSVHHIFQRTQNISCSSHLTCECLSPDCTVILEEVYSQLLQTISRLKSTYLFIRFIEPVITVSILCLGLLLDGTLLFIFFRHREVRTTNNAMLINIAVSDMLGLTVVLPIKYALYNYHNKRNIFVMKLFALMASQTVLIFVSAFSTLAISAQRCFVISKSLRDFTPQTQSPSRFNTALCIMGVWGAALGITLGLGFLMATASDDRRERSRICIVIVTFLVAAFVLPLCVTVLNARIAAKLHRSARDMPGISSQTTALVRARHRSSAVIIGLSATFWFTHSPFLVWVLVMISHGESLPRYIPSVIYHLFFSNAFLNPLSLYITSRTFRKLFKRYIFRCCYTDYTPRG
ncbi:neuropeptide CCHamide-2 receptor-like isoform X3 [Zootermopsis nevadensis]|nr:neuropeptide CCHamide-2 receptor-like isoform X3 [Zootermopsis nevadensis]